ncbi:MAG: leucine-rich repeat protein [Oscillospiraceae bacterium]|nr:leucine-rich repeat protein [Oscillospiraceae bacterium]
MKRRKWKTLLLAAVLITNMSVMSQFEEKSVFASFSVEGSCGELLWAFESEGTLTIRGDGVMDDYDAFSKPPWDKYMHLIKKVIIRDYVERIGSNSFNGAVSLTSVEILDGIDAIGDYVFADCARLEKIDLPESVSDIGEGTFKGCSSLKSIEIPKNIKIISSNLFEGCSVLESIVMSNVETIDKKAFYGCSSLEKINIPKTVNKIYDAAFEGCSSLKNIFIPDKVTSISNDLFRGCSSLEELNLHDNVKQIGSKVIFGCKKIKEVSIPAQTVEIDDDAFDGSFLSSVTVDKENMEYENIGSVLFNKGVTKLIYYPPEANIERYYVPDRVRTINKVGNKYLKELILPRYIDVLEKGVFDNCSSLKTLDISENITKIEDINCESLESIYVSPTNSNYASVDGVLFNKEKTKLIKYPASKKETSYAILDGVESIDHGAFGDEKYIEKLTVPESLKEFYKNNYLSSYFHSLTDVYYAGNKNDWEKIHGTEDLYENINLHFCKDEYYNESEGLRGDINNDGVVTAADIFDLYKYLVGNGRGIEYSEYRFDVKTDGKIDIFDVAKLKLALMNDITLWDNTNMPKMDGNFSAVPLETVLKADMLGISCSQATDFVSHNKSNESFELLLSGENDLVFTDMISEQQKKIASDAGVELIFTPVAKEGLVFMVSKDNPVNSLTQEQIRDIFSGKITNWSEVGGNNKEIVVYQRNSDSLSQNYMTKFMNGYSLADVPKSQCFTTISMLTSKVAANNNSSLAIGYTVYSNAAKMLENMENVKFISVDGIKPSNETISDNSYPLLNDMYILYTNEASEETVKFTQWAVSKEGQQLVLEGGYIPAGQTDISDASEVYVSKGTGKEKAKDYIPSTKYSTYSDTDCLGIDFLKDKEFESVINSDISKAVKIVKEKYDIEQTALSVEIINGYMSVVIYDDAKSYKAKDTEKLAILNYNLIDRSKIEKFSDLFYKGIDYVPIINENVCIQLSDNIDVKTGFGYLTGEVDKFTLSHIFIDRDDIHYVDYTSYYTPDYMVTGEYFDISTLVELEDIEECDYLEWNIVNVEKDGVKRQWIEGSRFHTVEEIEMHQKIYDKIYEDAMKRQEDPENPERIIIKTSDTRFNVLYVNNHEGSVGQKYNMYDPQTGERVYISDILGDDFKGYDEGENYLEDINLGTNIVKIYTNKGMVERVIFPDKLNRKYIKKLL